MNNTNKKGFSLIELSIVLIIIGLLVAGITGGASLIKSAELRAVMSDIRNYQTAINAYYTARGENEGIVDASLSSFTKETTTNQYTCTTSMTSVNVSNSIGSKMKGGYYALGYNDDMLANVIFIVGNNETVAKMETATAGSASSLGTTVISRKDAKFLDDKMDNGISDSGKMYGFTGSNTSGSNGCVYDNSTSVIPDEATRDCGVAISIGL